MKWQRQDLNSGPWLLSSCSFPHTFGKKALLFFVSASAAGLGVGVGSGWQVGALKGLLYEELRYLYRLHFHGVGRSPRDPGGRKGDRAEKLPCGLGSWK